VNETSVPVFQTLNTYQVATQMLTSETQSSSATDQRDLSVQDTSSVYLPHPSMNSYTSTVGMRAFKRKPSFKRLAKKIRLNV
jgi:hypothetical protein